MKDFFKEKSKLIFIVIVGLGLAIQLFLNVSSEIQRSAKQVMATSGEIDLASINLEKTNISLNGEWAFYWRELYDADTINYQNIKPSLYGKVPNVWNKYTLDNKNLPGFGYATYALSIKGLIPNTMYGLRIDTMSTAYSLFVDDTLLARNGVVAKTKENYEPFNVPEVAFFTSERSEVDIIVHVANFEYARGGMWYETIFGTQENILNNQRYVIQADSFIFGAITLLTVFYVGFFFIIKQYKKSVLFFLVGLTMIVRVLIYGDYFLVRQFDDFYYPILVWLNYLTIFWLPILIYSLGRQLFSNYKYNVSDLIIYGCGIIMTILTFTLSIETLTSYVTVANTIAILISSYGIITIVIAIKDKKETALLFSLSMVIMLLLGVHDMLYQANVITHSFGELLATGLVFMFFVLGVIQAIQAVEANTRQAILQNAMLQSESNHRTLTQRIKQLQAVANDSTQDKPRNILVFGDDSDVVVDLIDILSKTQHVITLQSDLNLDNPNLNDFNLYDLLILDIEVFDFFGFELINMIRKSFDLNQLPILVVIPEYTIKESSLIFELDANDYIAYPFNSTEVLSRVRGLINVKANVKKSIQSELHFLQAQIKPHFLYNALSVISSLSLKDPKQSKELILDLSDYLRGNFDFKNNDDFISIDQEMKVVDAYISLEKARFNERLQVVKNIDENITMSIPSFTIQPLIENAIAHGIMPRQEGGIISLTIQEFDDRLVVSVMDDGVGISKETIKKLLSHDSDLGVGIKNIHQRLIRMYGDGLHIESEVGKYTRVYFEIRKDM